jgi:hypothetical protein
MKIAEGSKYMNAFALLFPGIIFLFPGHIFCQSKPVSINCIPRIYILPDIDLTADNIQDISSGTIWEVISDRSGNVSYSDFTGKTVKERIKFLETFYVCNQSGEYLHIYADPGPDFKTGLLSSQAVDKGWIRRSTVLLWKHCLIEKSTKRNIQILTYSQADIFTAGNTGSGNNDGIVVYNDPGLKTKSVLHTQPRQLYYIYKITDESILIGNSRRIPYNSDPGEVILGWIPVNFSYRLDNRIWICPNIVPDAEEERRQQQITPLLLMSEQQALMYHDSHTFDSKFLMWKMAEDPLSTNCVCFPLISERNRIFRVKYIEDNFKTGFAPYTVDGLHYPLFSKVTLMNSFELNQVIHRMETIMERTNVQPDRDAIRKCFADLLKGSDYNDFDEEIINNLTFREIFESLFWITTSVNPIMDYKFRKILDISVIPDDELMLILKKIHQSKQALDKIANLQSTGCSFLSNDIRYFFIDLELFP